jgi:hypothetical protein
LKQSAAFLKSSVDEVPQKVESGQEEIAELKKELANLRAQAALSTFNSLLANVQGFERCEHARGRIPDSNADTCVCSPTSSARNIPGGSRCTRDNWINCHRSGDRRPRQARTQGGRSHHRYRRQRRRTSHNASEGLKKVTRVVEEKLK